MYIYICISIYIYINIVLFFDISKTTPIYGKYIHYP